MLKNYISLYFKYLNINIKGIMIYDFDFIFGIIRLFLKKIMSFCILIFIYNLLDNLKGWSFNQLLFLFGFSTTSYAIWHCFFINTISISYYIRYGMLDRFLLRPINPIYQIMTDGFDEDGWGELAFGIVILIISIIRLKIVSFFLLMLPFLLIGASLIYASVSLLLSIFSFFTIGNFNLSNLVMDFNEFAKYPLTIYNQVLSILFTIIIPVGFAAYYPSIMFMTNYTKGIWIALISPVISLCFFMMVCKLWMYSLKFYTSSGS